jgi:hypothetical protein
MSLMMLRCLIHDNFIGYDVRYLFRKLKMNQVFASCIFKPLSSPFDFCCSKMFLINFPCIYSNASLLDLQEDISS